MTIVLVAFGAFIFRETFDRRIARSRVAAAKPSAGAARRSARAKWHHAVIVIGRLRAVAAHVQSIQLPRHRYRRNGAAMQAGPNLVWVLLTKRNAIYDCKKSKSAAYTEDEKFDPIASKFLVVGYGLRQIYRRFTGRMANKGKAPAFRGIWARRDKAKRRRKGG